MLNRADISRLIADVLRADLANRQEDSLATFKQDISALWDTLSPEVKSSCEQKTADLFGYMPRSFSSLERITDYAYASFLKNQQLFLTKTCPYTVHQMWQEGRNLAGFFSNIKRVVSVVPALRGYGFFTTIVLPHTLEVPVLSLPPLPTQPWDELLQPGDLVVGFEFFWLKWLSCQNRFPSGVQVLCAAAPCKDKTIEALLSAGATHFTEIYTSDQAGTIAVRTRPNSLFEILPVWDISLKEKNPLIRHSGGTQWFNLPDKVVLQNERFLFPVASLDGSVQIAGVSVYPKQIEAVLASHPAIKECRVRLMRPDEGYRLKAFVVLKEGFGPEEIASIRQMLADKLTPHEIPRTFTFGEMLPGSLLHKDTDW